MADIYGYPNYVGMQTAGTYAPPIDGAVYGKATGSVKTGGYKVYGVSIDLTNSDPESSVTYTDDATGLSPGDEWDSRNIFQDIRPCVLKGGTVQYYLNPLNYSQKEDGTAADITTGNAGDVMVEIPKTGYRIETVGDTLTVQVTDDPNREGFHYYAHTRNTEGDREKLYVGAYLGIVQGNALRSLSGKIPTANQTFAIFRTRAQANGSGYDLMSFYPLTLLQCLYLVRFKSLDSQTALGRGYVDGNTAATATGSTNAKGMNFGETTGKQQMKLLGIEDAWGNLRYAVDGVYANANREILTGFQNFNNNASGYTNRGQGIPANVVGAMTKPAGTSETGFVQKVAGGSQTTYFCDYANRTAQTLMTAGGPWAGASAVGMFYTILAEISAEANASQGARLMYL